MRAQAKKHTYKRLYVLPSLYVLQNLYVCSFVLPNWYMRFYVLPNLYGHSYLHLYVPPKLCFFFKNYRLCPTICHTNPQPPLTQYSLSSIRSSLHLSFLLTCHPQTFKWLNQYKSVKSMNEPHFVFFHLYMCDLRNLHLEKGLRLMAKPKSAQRL